MQKIILSHKTGLYVIRRLRSENSEKSLLKFIEAIVHSRNKYGTQNLDILVNSQNKKHNNWRFNYHVHKNFLPKNSTTKLSSSISVVCPELLLIQLARVIPLEALCVIALEFCGTYSMSCESGDFVSNIKPITCVKKIRDYIDRFSRNNFNAWGISNLRKACSFIADNSASPMESRLFVKLCGPRSHGMYECGGLELNSMVNISSEARKIAGQNVIVPDISNINKKVAIEYNSTEFHEDTFQGQKDQRRRDALVHDGWKVFSFTPEQVYNRQTFKIVASQILHALGQNNRIRAKNFNELNLQAFELLR